MTARFIPPTPNCGHVQGVTFTHDVSRDLWMCPKCVASLGTSIFPICTGCGRDLPKSALLSKSAPSTCSKCQRESLDAWRSNNRRNAS